MKAFTNSIARKSVEKRHARLLITRNYRAVALLLTITLTAWAQPVITNQPQNQWTCVRTDATFTVGVTGAEPFSYQWQRTFDGVNFSDLPACTNATLVLTNVQTMDYAYYRVVITNLEGAVNSELARIDLAAPPVIMWFGQPPNRYSVSLGVTIAIGVGVSSIAPLSYQWRRNGEPLASRTQSSLSLNNVQMADAGDYDVVVANLCGATNSPTATVVVDPTFTKITTGCIVTDSPGTGRFSYCGWADYDCDGWEDVFVSSQLTSSVLYRNNRDGSFSRITSGAPLTSGTGIGVAWGDYDNDGFPDLFHAKYHDENNRLWRNNGNGTFASLSTSVPGQEGGSISGSWADYDGDGFLDLFVSNKEKASFLYHNNRAGDFTKITSGVPYGTTGTRDIDGVYGCAWGDYNNDGLLDLLLSSNPSALWQNQGDGVFTLITNSAITLRNEVGNGEAWGDYDNDGDLDVFLSNLGPNALCRNNGDGTFTRLTNSVAVRDPRTAAVFSFSAAWGDYDNDGYLDLFVPNAWYVSLAPPQKNCLFHNDGNGDFTRITKGSPVNDRESSRYGSYSAAWVDYNNDGFLDLFVANDDVRNTLYRNNGNTNHWLRLKLVGTVSNRSAIGAKVRVHATIRGDPFWQLRGVANGDGFNGSSMIAHFGLGDATNADMVRIEWPSGIVQELCNVPANQVLTVTEPARLNMTYAGELGIQCWKGQAFDLEASTDLSTWTHIASVTNTTGTLTFADPTAGSPLRRFYRALAK